MTTQLSIPDAPEVVEPDSDIEKPEVISPSEQVEEQMPDETILAQDLLGQERFDRFRQTGEITEADIAQIAKDKGISEREVRKEVVFLQSERQRAIDAALERVGGEAAWKEIQQWAAGNLTNEEKQQYRAALDSSDEQARSMALDALKARYEAVPKAPARARPSAFGKPSSKPSVSPYPSDASGAAAIARDLSDPRYKSDPAFQQLVDRRLAASDFSLKSR